MPFDGKPEQYTESQVRRDLRAALELLGPNGACHYRGDGDWDDRLCAMAAAGLVVRRDETRTDEVWARLDAFEAALLGVIGPEYKDVPSFSDNSPFEVVRAKFIEAINAA
jgi:hypothetical protein